MFVRRAITVALAIGSMVVAAPPAHAAPGQLDRSFGTRGATFTRLGKSAVVNAMAMQPDGKSVVAGVALTSDNDRSARVGLARYLPDGRLDRTFGRGGVVIERSGRGEAAYDVLLQPDGKIVVAGDYFAVRRYLPNGAPDRAFAAPRQSNGSAFAAALQPDGKIVVAGARWEPLIPATDIVVVRHRRDGRLDPTFAQGGRFVMRLPGTIDLGMDVAVAPDGGIVVGGWTAPATGGFVGINVMRLTPSGELEWLASPTETWSRQLTEGSTDHFGHALVVRRDGRILLGGMAHESNWRWSALLVQLRPDGTLDPDFGDGGIAIPFAGRPSNETIEDLFLRPNGDVIMAGARYFPQLSSGFVARIHPDGSLDRGFGKRGAAVTAFPGRNSVTSWSGVGPGPRGSVTVAGWYCLYRDPCRFAIARYLGR